MCDCKCKGTIVSSTGPKGDQGVAGPQGEKGDKGDTGSQGTDPIINDGNSTLALSSDQTGSTVVLNRAAGSVVTLPSDATIGVNYDFVVGTSVTSNVYSIGTNDGLSVLTGSVFVKKSAANDTIFSPSSSDDTINMNGTTTGGLIGTAFNIKLISANNWFVSGYTTGSGTIATPFTH